MPGDEGATMDDATTREHSHRSSEREAGVTSADSDRARSQENFEVARKALLASSHGDPMAGAVYFDPAIVWDLSGIAGWPEQPVYRGLEEEVEPFLRAWASSFAEWHFDVEDVRPASDGRVFSAIHEWGIGAGSGAKVDQHRYFICSVRDGLMVEVRMFSDRSEALRLAGLEE
jgi:ketosteroid isomerase-like protein